MRLAPLVARIKAQVPALSGRVAAAADLKAVLDSGVTAMPCAFVFAPSGKAGPNTLMNRVSQNIDVRFGVVLVVRNVSDPRGDAAYAEMDALRPALWDALGGWVPDDGMAPLQSDGDQLLYAQDGLLIWNEQFRTNYYKRSI